MSQRYNDNTKKPKLKETQPGILKIYMLLENSAEGLECRRKSAVLLELPIHL